MTPSIFISYNSGIPQEETLAVRLQTIGAVSGFNTLLPDRFRGNRFVDQETAQRIKSSDYFVLFFMSNRLSKEVSRELKIAFDHFKDPSKIIVLYNPEESPITDNNTAEATFISFDPRHETVDIAIKKLLNKIDDKEKSKDKKESQKGLLALLGIGLGLWALGTLLKDD